MGDYDWDAVSPLAGGVVEIGADVVNSRHDVILSVAVDQAGGASALVHLTPREVDLLVGRLMTARDETVRRGT